MHIVLIRKYTVMKSDVHVTMHHDKFSYNKTNWMD